MDWERLFCEVDDFCLVAEPLSRQRMLADGRRHRHRKGRLTASEIITILIAFHQGNFRTFKHFYLLILGKVMQRFMAFFRVKPASRWSALLHYYFDRQKCWVTRVSRNFPIS